MENVYQVIDSEQGVLFTSDLLADAEEYYYAFSLTKPEYMRRFGFDSEVADLRIQEYTYDVEVKGELYLVQVIL